MMLRLALAQLRFRPGRAAVLLVVLIATGACFALVGASAKTQPVTVHGPLEAASGAAARVRGVGHDSRPYNVAGHLPGPALGQSQVLYRLTPTFISENGLTKIPAEEQYLYTTTAPLTNPLNEPDPASPHGEGRMLAICQAGDDPASTSEIVPACGSTSRQDAWNTPSAANPHATGSGVLPTGTQDIAWYFPFLVEAIDPAQEAKLDGLDHAISTGSYLSESA